MPIGHNATKKDILVGQASKLFALPLSAREFLNCAFFQQHQVEAERHHLNYVKDDFYRYKKFKESPVFCP